MKSVSRFAVQLWLEVLTLLCLCALVVGQNSRGTILGHVADPSGAVVVGAKVTVRNVNTGVTNQFVTNSAGDYVLVNLIPGIYDLTVESPGFKMEQSQGLVLEVDQTLRQDYRLTVGTANEQVQVTADTQMVPTTPRSEMLWSRS
jgi:hypothetical protein